MTKLVSRGSSSSIGAKSKSDYTRTNESTHQVEPGRAVQL